MEREGACWRCESRVGLAPACGTCHAPQPVNGQVDHYDILGVERSLVVDPAELDCRYHDLARSIHPDRHQVGGARSATLSVQATAALNRAYRTLREPIARGRYWLDVHGRSLTADNNRVPPALATLVFDVQEQLEELRAAPNAAGVRAGVEAARADVKARLGDEIAALEACYATWKTAADASVLDDLKQRLTQISYLKTLLGDVEEVLGA